ncbi:DUF3102 domain-containing protein [Azospirillum palustre]
MLQRVGATIIVGRCLNEAKAALLHGEYEAMVATDLPFSTSTARKLREIAAFVDEGRRCRWTACRKR